MTDWSKTNDALTRIRTIQDDLTRLADVLEPLTPSLQRRIDICIGALGMIANDLEGHRVAEEIKLEFFPGEDVPPLPDGVQPTEEQQAAHTRKIKTLTLSQIRQMEADEHAKLDPTGDDTPDD